MPDETPLPRRPQLFSEEFITRIGEDLANQIIDQICRGLTAATPAQRPTTLCIELLVFEIDEHILRNLVKCTFAQMNPVLITQEILKAFHHVNTYLNNHKTNLSEDSPAGNISPPATQPSIPPPAESYDLSLCKFELLRAVALKVRDLSSNLLNACDLRERLFEEVLLHPTLLPASELKNLYTVINHVIIQQFREMFITQHDNFALKLCNKTSCINSDLEFLTDQIKQLTINFPAAEKGIIEIADAAGSVAESFFSEKDDFDEIFDAVDAVAEVIEDLAEFYQVKLAQLEKLLSLSTAGCPVPIQARVTLPAIPETPPPPPIFPVVTIPGSISLPTTPSLIP